MKIAITGSTGLVGKKLSTYFKQQGDVVYPLVRSQIDPSPNMIFWDPTSRKIDASSLEGMDVVIHLAAENISTGRWTKQKKERIRSSRVEGTSFLSTTLTQLQSPPHLLLSASAIGYYGKETKRETFVETSKKAEDYLSNVVEEWEQATLPAHEAGIRTVQLRFGVILDPSGGALQKMLPPFRLGFGGRLGHGRQLMSWISLMEIPSIIQFLIDHPNISGPVNVVSPNAVDNITFTQVLGKAVDRPTFFTMPAPVMRLLFGEMADYLLLSGNKVLPNKLTQSGYQFKEPNLDEALQRMV